MKNVNKFTQHLYLFLALILCSSINIYAQKVHTSYLWHMDQPVYWADKSKDKPDSKQFAEESHRLKMAGQNMYPGSSVAHPTNDLQEIFSKDDRVNAYQYAPKNAINSIKDISNAGAQLSISGGLMDNIQSLGVKNQWGYSSAWMNPYKEAIGWKTSGGFPRLDVVGFTYDHALSPLVSERTLKKQIQSHQYSSMKYYGHISKGYWPAECAFSERIIKVLKECGIEWSVIANSHLARTLSDYAHPYNINGNIDAPNRADQVSTVGTNWFEAAIDGRGSKLAAPYSYQAHKARYVDPQTGTSYTIDVIPMCNYLSYVDGYSGASTGEIASKIEPYSNASHPSIVLLAHDGDNAWGGGSSYYNEAVTSFSHSASSAGYEPVTIQQFLNDHPVPANDIVRVEDGAWVNADSDWGHPQFFNWLWPLYSSSDYRFNPDGWTEDARNWAVITATENYVTMAEDLEGGNLNIQRITEGGTSATNAEKAWHFYFGGLNSGFMYYGKAEDMEVKPSMTGNIAIEYANKVLNANPGVDNTPPSVFIPQRFPYNPGGIGWGPTTGYKKVNYSSDFHVWTYAYDVSGLKNVTLKYRLDKDGWRTIESIQNETYAGGNEVEAWQSIDMTRKPMASDPTDDAELNFFIMPNAKADLCYAEITGLKDKLIDYYVEAEDMRGNVFKTPIQHVYIGTGDGEIPGDGNVTWETSPTTSQVITITCKNATATSKLHWGVNKSGTSWTIPNDAYRPSGSVAVNANAVETPFTLVDGKWQVNLGPFNNPAQEVSKIHFVINHGSNNWDNNGGSDYLITVSAVASDNPTGKNISVELDANKDYTFSVADFGFNSPKGNTFKGIKVMSLPSEGNLKLSGANVSINQIVTNVTSLVYTTGTSASSFTFKLIDSADLLSDASYTASFAVKGEEPEGGITVSFKKPDDWNSNDVHIWAWNSSGNLFTGWPGVLMTPESNNWYSYTFDKSVSSVNVIFSKNGDQWKSVDIENITSKTCYEQSNKGNPFSVQVIDCPLNTGISNLSEGGLKALIYPRPVLDKFIVELPNIGNKEELILNIVDFSGKIVKSTSFTGDYTIVERGNLPSGFYIVKIFGTQSKYTFSEKLILK